MDSLKRKIIAATLYMFYGVIMYVIVNAINPSDFDDWVNLWLVAVLSLAGCQIMLMCYMKLKVFSLIGFFLLLSYVFHFGHLPLLSTPFKNLQMGSFVIRHVGQIGFRQAIMYCSYVMYMLFFGIIMGSNSRQAYQVIEPDVLEEQRALYCCRVIGEILLTSGLPFFLYATLLKVSVSVEDSYGAIARLGIPSYVNFLATMFSVGICIVMIGYRERRKVARGVLVFGISLQTIRMVSGNRGLAVIEVLLYLYIFYGIIGKIGLKRLLFLGLLGYCALGFLAVIASIRDHGVSLGALMNGLSDLIGSKSPLLLALQEFGGTLLTPAIAMQKVPHLVKPALGQGYVNSLLNLVGLNLGSVRTHSYVTLINIGGMGGSFIGELYYNFMSGGILFSPIIGYVVCRVSRDIQYAIKRRRYIDIAYKLPFFIGVMWWVRDSLTYLIRISVGGAILVFMVSAMVRFFSLLVSRRTTA